jgi:hypothetical protein
VINCGDFERIWNLCLDERGMASPELLSSLESHSAECPSCRSAHGRYAVLAQALRTLGPMPPLPADFSTRVLQELGQQLATRRAYLFPPRRIAVFAIAAGILLALGVSTLRPPDRNPTAPPIVSAPTNPPEPHDLSEALAAATDATWKLASETSAPAARIGLDILESTTLPGSSVTFSMADSVELEMKDAVDAPTSLFQSLGERVNAGVGPLSGTARQAFGFLLGSSEDPRKPAQAEPGA